MSKENGKDGMSKLPQEGHRAPDNGLAAGERFHSRLGWR